MVTIGAPVVVVVVEVVVLVVVEVVVVVVAAFDVQLASKKIATITTAKYLNFDNILLFIITLLKLCCEIEKECFLAPSSALLSPTFIFIGEATALWSQ
jgi:hypothetical protein